MQLLNFCNTQVSNSDRQFSIFKGLKSLVEKLLIVKSFIAMLLDDDSLETVGELTYGLLSTPSYEKMAQYLNQNPACASLICDRYIPPNHDLDKLITYPLNSLGYIYATTIKTMGYNPNLHAGMEAKTDAEYIELRLSQTHDIWHIITGFDTSFVGEIGLQAFHLTQFPYPLATMLIANSLISVTMKAPEILPELVDAIAKGFQMGKNAQPLFAKRWEEGWEKPLTQWQKELNIQPITNN
jgi:ubiquinone biosynthesis protein COQ4